jgi:HlyD family secretion protein
MAEGKRRSPIVLLRPLILLIVAGGIGFVVWRNATRSEGYTGGDVVTTGTIEAVHVDLGFKIPGRIADVPVSEGTDVSAGEIVARLEPEDLDGQIHIARADLEAARAALAQARAARDQAALDLKRQYELMKVDGTTQQALDAARTDDEMSVAKVEAAAAQVHRSEIAVGQAMLQRSYADLRAPEAGEVSVKIHRPGEMVLAGTPVVTVAEMDTVKVHAAVDETRVGAIRTGDTVRVKVYTFDHLVFEGRVTDVQPIGDFATRKDWGAQRRDIRTFTVTGRVPNPQHLLKDGMTAEVTIVVDPSVRTLAERKP